MLCLPTPVGSERGATGLTSPSGSLWSLGNVWCPGKRRRSLGKREGASPPFTPIDQHIRKLPTLQGSAHVPPPSGSPPFPPTPPLMPLTERCLALLRLGMFSL